MASPSSSTSSTALLGTEDNKHSAIEHLRIQLKSFLVYSYYGKIYDWCLLVLSVGSCFLYINETYADAYTTARADTILEGYELSTAALFSFDFMVSLFVADNRLDFVRSFFSMVDILTVIPTWLTLGYQRPILFGRLQPDVLYYYILFGLKTTRILRPLRMRKKLLHITDEVQQTLAIMILSILIMILFNSAVMQYLEFEVQPLPFHTWMYFIWITTSTVGYGDISPVSTQGKMAVIYMIGFAIVVVPSMTTQLLEKMSETSPEARTVYTPTNKSKHILISGDLTSTAIDQFFTELFSEDKNNFSLVAVVLHPAFSASAAIAMKRILNDPKYMLSVLYLEGSTLIVNDLKRAHVQTASAIFILCNKFSATPGEDDAKVILQHFRIRAYCQMFHKEEEDEDSSAVSGMSLRLSNQKHENKSCHRIAVPKEDHNGGIFSMFNNTQSVVYCIQVIRPVNRKHLSSHERATESEHEHIVCLNEMKMGIISKSVMVPGTSTLVMNLLTAFTPAKLAVEGAEEEWLAEYKKGCGWEIFSTEMSPIFEGSKFAELSYCLYFTLGIVLFGLQVEDLKAHSKKIRTLVNPSNYVFPSQNNVRLVGLVIGLNKASCDLSHSTQHSAFQLFRKNNGSSSLNLSVMGLQSSVMGIQTSAQTSGKVFPKVNENGSLSNMSVEMKDVKDMKASANKNAPFVVLPKKAAVQTDNSQAMFKKVRHMKFMERFDNIRNSSDSAAEKMYNIENEFLLSHYFLRDSSSGAAKLSEITMNSVIEEVPHIHGHIIIAGKGIDNLYDLIRPLRARDLGPLKYIVILHPVDLSHAVWQRISIFEGLLFVRGSALEEKDLCRAGIFRAHKVVLLSAICDKQYGSKTAASYDATSSNVMLDSDTIFTYKACKQLNNDVQFLVEFVNDTNVKYLNVEAELGKPGLGQPNFRMCPQYAAGDLFLSSTMDVLAVRAFYNPQMVNVINRLLCGRDNRELAEATAEATNTKGVFKMKGMDAIAGSTLYQIDVPSAFVYRRYGMLFKELALQGIIPVGLYRGIVHELGMGPKNNHQPYVLTNPDADTELYACDKVFVLSTQPLHSSSRDLDEDKESDIKMNDEIVKAFQLSKQQQPGGHSRINTMNGSRWMSMLDRMEDYCCGLDVGISDFMGDAFEICRNRIDEVLEDTYKEVDSDDEENESDAESEFEDHSEGSEASTKAKDTFMKAVNKVKLVAHLGSDSKLTVDENNELRMKAAFYEKNGDYEENIKPHLSLSTRQAKYISEKFLVPIKALEEAIYEKRPSALLPLVARYAKRAHEVGLNKMCCWLLTFHDVVMVLQHLAVHGPVGNSPVDLVKPWMTGARKTAARNVPVAFKAEANGEPMPMRRVSAGRKRQQSKDLSLVNMDHVAETVAQKLNLFEDSKVRDILIAMLDALEVSIWESSLSGFKK